MGLLLGVESMPSHADQTPHRSLIVGLESKGYTIISPRRRPVDGIVSFTSPATTTGNRSHAAQHKTKSSFAKGGFASPHFYNGERSAHKPLRTFDGFLGDLHIGRC